MNEDARDESPKLMWLTRSEAARYVGLNGESAIRAAEERGLESQADCDGKVWLSTAALEAWNWRRKLPSVAKRATVLRQAERTREREARERERQEEAEIERIRADCDAQAQSFEAETALRASVRQKARELREAFERDYMDERTAGLALGFKGYEASARVRDLIRRGLLRRIESPREPSVELSFEGVREVESTWPLCPGGPFVPRDDVLALRRESAQVANVSLGAASHQVKEIGDVLAAVLRAVLARSR